MPGATASANSSPAATTMKLTSNAFTNAERIPDKYTCTGENVSPQLAWSGAPAGVRSYVLIMDDPDAPRGTFDHWVVYNLPSETQSLPEGATPGGLGAKEGVNGAGRVGYMGPCPPPGKAHGYRFTVYALADALGIPAGATKAAVLAAIEGRVLVSATLVGTFSR